MLKFNFNLNQFELKNSTTDAYLALMGNSHYSWKKLMT